MKKALPFLLLLSLSVSAFAEVRWRGGIESAAQLDAGPGLHYGLRADALAPDDEGLFRLGTLFSDKGAAGFSLCWDAHLPLAGLRLSTRLASLDDPFSPFYGFNGAAEERNSDADPAHNAFHKAHLQASMEVSAPISGALRWQAGFRCHYVDAGRISSVYGFESATLYDRYKTLDLLRKEEQTGGERISTLIGLNYESEHIAAALAADISPDLFRDGNAYTRLGGLSQAFGREERFRLQATLFGQHSLSGQAPWYLLDELLLPVHDGALLRCALPGRLAARGYAGANIDFHAVLMAFHSASREWKLEAVPFCDLLLLTQTYRLHEMALASLGDTDYEQYLRRRTHLPHESAGLKLQLNAPDRGLWLQAGAPFHREDGLLCLNLGIRFAF